MIRPTRTYLLLAMGGFAVATVPVIAPSWWVLWVAYVAALVLVGGLDVVRARRPGAMECVVKPPTIAFLGESTEVDVRLDASADRLATEVEVLLEVEGDVEPPEPEVFTVGPGGFAEGSITLEPRRRGQIELVRVHMRWLGPMGMMSRTAVRELDGTVDVAPNIAAVRRAALRLATHNAFMMGAKQLKFIGDGTEFAELREYAPGLDIRSIDWRATARHRTLMSREYRAERHHRVVLAMDTGHLMRAPVDGLPKLDHAINAALMLGYMSLKMGDQVGLFGFDAAPNTWVAPQSGVHHMQRILKHSAELAYSPAESNFTLALTGLSARLRRRAVVVVFTDFTDTVGAELMVERLGVLARRHLVIFVAIRDAELDRIASEDPTDAFTLNRAVVAGELQQERDVVIAKLRRQGIFCVDGTPAQVSIDLINRYLDVHRRELVS